LVTRYRARYGKTPYRLASLGYDAVLLAVRSAKNWPLGRAFPAKSLIDPDGFGGVDGAFRFARDGVAERLLEVRQVTPAGTTTIAPAAARF
jgi:branched-chain amino acid transport system substrate-binding protein